MGLGGKLAEVEVSSISAAPTARTAPPDRRASKRTVKPARARAEAAHTPAPPRRVRKTADADAAGRLKEQDPEVEAAASETLTKLMGFVGAPAQIDLHPSLEDGYMVFDLAGDNSGLLIGSYGETLQALQRLANLIVHARLGRQPYIKLDIANYRERRAEILSQVAYRAAQKAIARRAAESLPPMSPSDRRLVHICLANDSRVTTNSEGKGRHRYVVVKPADAG